ncbi:hypothetical protein F2P79_000023 [Pimephales promelas]|nr:hypothetical protein F2P79_000023 [Pimephales promelas]
METWKNTAWSNEEVQTFLCLVAEERIQRELDRATRNERRRYDNRVWDEWISTLDSGCQRCFKPAEQKESCDLPFRLHD